MDVSPNIYRAIVFDLHPKVRGFLDSLDQAGQIDRDDTNSPHIIAVEPDGSVHRCIFVRNGKTENFVLHTRKRAEPVCSWSDQDGFVRAEKVSIDKTTPSRKERDRRTFESIMEQILPRR